MPDRHHLSTEKMSRMSGRVDRRTVTGLRSEILVPKAPRTPSQAHGIAIGDAIRYQPGGEGASDRQRRMPGVTTS